MKKPFLLLLLSCLTSLSANATHVRAGSITYEHKEGLTYTILLTGYADTGSAVLFGSNGIVDFGDGTSMQVNNEGSEGWIPRTKINDNTWKYEMVLDHTYAAEGAYTLSFRELYRNEGILNIDNSVNMPFYVESLVVVGKGIQNNSVQFRQEPEHAAYLNQTYHYNAVAFDKDGDSLSYHLALCKQDFNNPVSNYRYPNQVYRNEEPLSETGESTYFTINPLTGDLIWDAPFLQGEYSIAFEVVEWRKINNAYIEVGRVARDMQLIVIDEEGSPYELNIPGLHFPVTSQVVQLEEGSQWELSITATADNPADTVILLLLGDLLYKNPEASPSDSVAGRGEATVSIHYTHGAEVNEQYQLIALSYVKPAYNSSSSTPRARSVQLLTPAKEPEPTGIKVERFNDVSIYPNPSSTNRFYLQAPELEGRRLTISLFDTGGRLVHQEIQPSFTPTQGISIAGKKLQGTYFLLLRQQDKLYFSRIVFTSR